MSQIIAFDIGLETDVRYLVTNSISESDHMHIERAVSKFHCLIFLVFISFLFKTELCDNVLIKAYEIALLLCYQNS